MDFGADYTTAENEVSVEDDDDDLSESKKKTTTTSTAWRNNHNQPTTRIVVSLMFKLNESAKTKSKRHGA